MQRGESDSEITFILLIDMLMGLRQGHYSDTDSTANSTHVAWRDKVAV